MIPGQGGEKRVDRPPSRFLLMLVCSYLSAAFRNRQGITMEGYDDEAMEPFVSRDGNTCSSTI
jgi:hypothetical protein